MSTQFLPEDAAVWHNLELDKALEQIARDDAEKTIFINELAQEKIKHKRDEILKIGKKAGQIFFLEKGKAGSNGSGLLHILEKHREDFAKRGISEDEIPDAVMKAVIFGTVIGKQGNVESGRTIYEVTFKERNQLIAVTLATNGYIVGANPASLP